MSAKLELTLFVVNPEKHQSLIDELSRVLQEYFPDNYSLFVIDVLATPEKAVENKVFATPMLIRSFPEPLMKLLVNISNLQDAFLSVTDFDKTKILI